MRFPALLPYLVVSPLVAGLGFCSAFPQASAQQPAPQTGPTPARAPAQAPKPATANAQGAALSTLLLTEGTEVYLTVVEDLSSKTAHEGDAVEFVLADDLKVGNVVVAKAGAKAVGEVTHADRRESTWIEVEGAELSVRPDYLKVGSYKIHLRGSFGVFNRRKDVRIAKGQKMTVHVSQDINLPPA